MISSMFAQQTYQQYGRFSRSVAIQTEKRIRSFSLLFQLFRPFLASGQVFWSFISLEAVF